jgi:hypothetical protein
MGLVNPIKPISLYPYNAVPSTHFTTLKLIYWAKIGSGREASYEWAEINLREGHFPAVSPVGLIIME